MGGSPVTDGIFVLFVLGACWASDAKEITTSGLSSSVTVASDVILLVIYSKAYPAVFSIHSFADKLYPDSEGEVKALQVISTNANKCVFLCEAFVAIILKYLKQSTTPIEMFNAVRKSCSQMGSFEQQCTTMVDRFGSQLIIEIGTMQPGFLCGKFNFSEHNTLMTSSLRSLDQYSLYSLDWCKLCHFVIAEVVVQLKDPDTRAAIIQGLSSACYFAMEYAGMCQALVSGLGPVALLELERFLESGDLCTTFRVCTMGVNRLTDGIFILFVLGACWASDAREITTSGLSSRETVTSDDPSILFLHNSYHALILEAYPDEPVFSIYSFADKLSGFRREVKALQVISTNANKCVFLCEAFVSIILKYLEQSTTPIEMFDTVRKSCSQMGSFEQQCTAMVDRFGSQLIIEIGTMQPGFLCGKFNFSEHNTLMTSSLRSLDQYSLYSLDWCKLCHFVIAEVVVQLKDPDTRCQALVSGIGPVALLELERFLESGDLCTRFRVCKSTSASSPQPPVVAKPPMAMISV
ncbi:hypothetical protein Acr_02g0007000 [Actinidia rufa]|uniref:Saposin B-type domain-containing protein n=1 Tax=Actinidia rufa TaxID=165716 RepID=A0A7J0E7T1_9ERIC|nr:hypothetical protein Acr_02g0007000 [Actinidia rufa]